MPLFERLAYFPRDMKEFVAFCVSGTHGDPNEPGVFEWLYSRKVPAAHFFTSDPSDPVQEFMVVHERLEQDAVPWLNKIKGFNRLIFQNGELAEPTAFPPLNQTQATIKHNQALDDQFAAGQQGPHKVFAALEAEDRSGFSFTGEDFTRMLRGDLSVDRRSEILAEIETKFQQPLFEKPDLNKVLASVSADAEP